MQKIKFTEILKLGNYNYKNQHYQIMSNYGRNAMFRVLNKTGLITFDPTLSNQLLMTKSHTKVRSAVYYLFRKIKGLNGILFMDGEQHEAHRNALAYIYTSKYWLNDQYRQVINNYFCKQSADATSFTLDLFKDFYDFGLDTFLIFCLGWSSNDPHSTQLKQYLYDYSYYHSQSTDILNGLVSSPKTVFKIWRASKKRNKIANHISAFLAPVLSSEPPELVQSMQAEGLTMDEIINEITHHFSAYKAVINTVIFAVYELAKQPELVAKLRNELTQLNYHEDVKNNNLGDYILLNNIMRETMRMYTISLTIMRRLGADIEVDGQKFEKGSEAMILLSLLHNNPEDWSDPDTFNPDRWLTNQPYFIPFLVGARHCLGKKFAEYFFLTCLSEIVLQYNLTTTVDKIHFKGQPYPEPKDPILVTLSRVEGQPNLKKQSAPDGDCLYRNDVLAI